MTLSPLVRKLIKWIGYPLFSLIMFVIFVYVTFPYEKLKSRIEQRAAASGEMELNIGSLGPSPLLGLAAKDILLMIKPKPGPRLSMPRLGQGAGGAKGEEEDKEKKKPKKPGVTRIVLDKVVVKIGLFALIGGATSVSFDVDGLGGEVEGTYTTRKKAGWSIKLVARSIDLAELPAISKAVGLPIEGKLSGQIDVKVPKNQWSAASGAISVECDGCAVGDGKAKLKIPGNAFLASGITLPKVRVGRFGGQIKIDKGVATLENVSSKSPDLEVNLEGSFSLRNPLPFSNAQAYLRFKISDQLKKRDPKFQLVESGLSSAKRTDGFYGMRIMGSLKNIRFIPSRLGPPGGGGPGLRSGPQPAPSGPRGYRRFPAHGRAPVKTSPRTPRPG